MKLFAEDWGEDNSPLDDPEITQVIFYFSKDEAALFKKLCKEGMKVEYPETYIQDGNITDLMLKVLNEKYANLLPKKTPQPSLFGEVEGDVS